MGEARSKMKLLKRVLVGFLILFTLLVLLAILFPGLGPKRMGSHLASWQRMNQIALAINQYRQAHDGANPQKFSQLVPVYANWQTFFIHSKYNTGLCFIPTNVEAHPELIDLFSPYSFALLPDKRILIWERPGMWTDDTMRYLLFDNDNQPTNIFQLFHSNSITAEVFEEKFLGNFH
ncbi:MAG: hypothetical protein WDM76_19415 [Limisphaerales bacterium]